MSKGTALAVFENFKIRCIRAVGPVMVRTQYMEERNHD